VKHVSDLSGSAVGGVRTDPHLFLSKCRSTQACETDESRELHVGGCGKGAKNRDESTARFDQNCSERLELYTQVLQSFKPQELAPVYIYEFGSILTSSGSPNFSTLSSLILEFGALHLERPMPTARSVPSVRWWVPAIKVNIPGAPESSCLRGVALFWLWQLVGMVRQQRAASHRLAGGPARRTVRSAFDGPRQIRSLVSLRSDAQRHRAPL
jgi:hypothetical protein